MEQIDLREASLAERSLIKATQNIPTLGGVLDFCNSREDFNDSCSKASVLWKVTINRTLGKWKVVQRGDLREEDWYNFAKLLALGLEFKYGMIFDGTNGTWSTIALPYSSIVIKDPALQVNPELSYYKFSIPGAVPVSGTRGYFINYGIYTVSRGMRNTKKFIVGPDMDRNFILAAQYVAEKFFKFHYDSLMIRNADFFDEANDHPDGGDRPPFPDNAAYFTDRILDVGLDPVTGYARGNWYVYYTNQVTLNHSSTSSDFDIIPFSF